jgi:hypothetical protein
MSDLDVLITEYPGDVAWRNFVAVFQPAWATRTDKDKFVSVIGNTDLAIVLAATLNGQAASWFERPIGALKGRSPQEVLVEYPNGELVLRTLVMRMPK